MVISWGVRQPIILNLHRMFRDSYITGSAVRPPLIHQDAAEGKRAVAVTHLALARRQNMGNGILGVLMIRKQLRLLFYRIGWNLLP